MPVTAVERQRRALVAQRATWGMRNDLKRAVRLHVYQTVLSMTDSVMAAVQEADARTAQQVRNVAEVFARGLAPADSKRAHQEIGAKAQKSVLASYAQVVTAGGNSRGNRYPYRRQARQPNRRYAGGALKRALADKDFFEATSDGLRFVNVTSLNRKARHWARLNAGAGPIGQGSRRRFQVRWSNLVVAAIGIEQAPRPAFFLPRGYWFSRGAGAVVSADTGRIGQDEFYPQGTGPFRGRTRLDGVNAGGYSGPGLAKRRPSRGIRARNFLDAGVATIARETPAAYERMYQRLWDQGVVGKGPQAKIQTNARPRPLRKNVRTTRRY